MLQKETEKNASKILLIGANLFPLLGILFYGWDAYTMLYLYWLESLIIGLFTVKKMVRARGVTKDMQKLAEEENIDVQSIHAGIKLFTVPTFVFLYFVCSFVQFLGLQGVQTLESYDGVNFGIGIPFLVLILSHYISYKMDYVGKEEYKRIDAESLGALPYTRIFVMHLAMILGVYLITVLNVTFQFGIGVALVSIKMYFEWASHSFGMNKWNKTSKVIK